jgi:hypothetical protein
LYYSRLGADCQYFFEKFFNFFLEGFSALPVKLTAGAVVDHPHARAAADDVLSTAVEGGNEPHHLSGGETEARPDGEAGGARDTGEREHQGHFLSREISQPVGGGRGVSSL